MRGIARLLPACLAVVAVLASCGGGNDRVATAPTTTSPTASTSGTLTETTLAGATPATEVSAETTIPSPDASTAGTASTAAGASTTVAAGAPSTSSGASVSSTTVRGVVASSSTVKPPTSTVKPSTSSSVAPSTSAATRTGGTKTITVDADQAPRTVKVPWGTDVTLVITSAKVQDFHVHAPIDVELSGTSVTFQFATDFGPADMALLAGGDTLMAESHTTGKPVVYLVIG